MVWPPSVSTRSDSATHEVLGHQASPLSSAVFLSRVLEAAASSGSPHGGWAVSAGCRRMPARPEPPCFACTIAQPPCRSAARHLEPFIVSLYAMDNIELMADGRSAQVGGEGARAWLRYHKPPLLGVARGPTPLWGLSPSCGGVAGQTDTMYRSASPQQQRSYRPSWLCMIGDLRERGPRSMNRGMYRPTIGPGSVQGVLA